MKLNNKGFAISSILYGLLVVITVILYLTFTIIRSNSNNQKYISSYVLDEINSCKVERTDVIASNKSINKYKRCYCHSIYKSDDLCKERVYKGQDIEEDDEEEEEVKEPEDNNIEEITDENTD